jgi:CBS domain-containing protein
MVFALELTHDVNSLLPLLVAVTVAHGFTVLTLRRSILTEKVSRRGYHLGREYSVDPLEIFLVKEVMRTSVAALAADTTLAALSPSLGSASGRSGPRLFPVLGAGQELVGVVTRTELERLVALGADGAAPVCLSECANLNPVVAYVDEPLRAVAYRMAATGVTTLPVLERGSPPHLVGMVTLKDLLIGRTRTWEEERRRERVLRLRVLPPSRTTPIR